MMREWSLQDAKAKFSEVVRLAMEKEPQEITLRGAPAVVVLSKKDYEALIGQKDAQTLVDFMRRSPLYGADDLVFERDTSPTREVDL